MLGRRYTESLRRIALTLSVLAASIASAHLIDDVWEAGYSRVKFSVRTRSWRDDPAALPVLASAWQLDVDAAGAP